MIHTLDLRDARVRVGFTLPTSRDEKSNSPEVFVSISSDSKLKVLNIPSFWTCVHPACKCSTNTNTQNDTRLTHAGANNG